MGDARSDGVVVGHRAQVLETADALQLGRCWSRSPGPGGIERGHREAAVEVAQEGGQETLRGAAVAHLRQAQLGHQAILERAPQAFDAALGLR